MPPRLRGKWALGITPRNFTWVLKDKLAIWLKSFYVELKALLDAGTKVIVHNEEVGDKIIGIMGGYIRWSGLVEDSSQAIMITERIAERQLDPFAREVILMAHTLR